MKKPGPYARGPQRRILPGSISAGYSTPLTFHELQRQVLLLLNEKVRRGDISQRRLARLTGFTQPHIHNVLKGARGMHAGLADAALECLELSLRDLLEPAALPSAPLRQGLLGPGRPFPSFIDAAVQLVFPAAFLSRFIDPVLVRLAADEDAMVPSLQPGDLVLLDQAEAGRRRPRFDGIYALALPEQSVICHCQRVGSALVLTRENARCSAPLPDRVPLADRNILDLVRGRVVWACREFGAILGKL